MAEEIGEFRDPEVLIVRYIEQPRSDLKDMIMVEYAGMVERIARRFSGIEPVEDLMQVGFIGLLNALSKFDPKAGVRFNTYATHLVAGEMKHYLRDKAQTIRHPAWLQELRQKVTKGASSLQAKLHRTPSIREIADELGMTEAAIQEVYQTQEMIKVASLDVPSEDDGDTDGENIEASSICAEQLSIEDRVVLETAMRQLRELERDVLVLFHFDSLNQAEIADRLNISCNYVSHILRQSLGKLRKILTDEDKLDGKLKRAANIDSIDDIDVSTGLYSEKYFLSRLQEEIHRSISEETNSSAILIRFRGLEHLKNFYGDASVQDFFADAAEFIKSSVRRLDVVCRYRNSSIAIILPSTGGASSFTVQRLFKRLENWLGDRRTPSGPITCDISAVVTPKDARTVSEVVARLRRDPDQHAAA